MNSRNHGPGMAVLKAPPAGVGPERGSTANPLMALTLSITSNRAGHGSFRPSLLEGRQREWMDLAARARREQPARAQTHGSMGGAWQRPGICSKRARSRLEARCWSRCTLPSAKWRWEFVTTASTVMNAILNARPESDITSKAAIAASCKLPEA